jgi:hypothetical protein
MPRDVDKFVTQRLLHTHTTEKDRLVKANESAKQSARYYCNTSQAFFLGSNIGSHSSQNPKVVSSLSSP